MGDDSQFSLLEDPHGEYFEFTLIERSRDFDRLLKYAKNKLERRHEENRLMGIELHRDREWVEKLERDLAVEREKNPSRVVCPVCQAVLPCESCSQYAKETDKAADLLEQYFRIRGKERKVDRDRIADAIALLFDDMGFIRQLRVVSGTGVGKDTP